MPCWQINLGGAAYVSPRYEGSLRRPILANSHFFFEKVCNLCHFHNGMFCSLMSCRAFHKLTYFPRLFALYILCPLLNMTPVVSMSEDDVAYTALLCQLLSDTSSSRNARVHSWIEHQYDFALSESSVKQGDAISDVACSRSPSPSPSSSLGAHRTFYSDRPDSPLLPRSSIESSSSQPESCPSYDALFFPATSYPQTPAEHDVLEERERERALRFLVQEMAQWKVQSSSTTPRKSVDKVSFHFYEPLFNELKFTHQALALSSTALTSNIYHPVHFVTRHAFTLIVDAHFAPAFIYEHIVFRSEPTTRYFCTALTRLRHCARGPSK